MENKYIDVIQPEQARGYSEPPPLPSVLPQTPAHTVPLTAQGFAQAFGVHPAIAFFTLIVDMMLFGAEGIAAMLGIPSGGLTLLLMLPVSCLAGAVVGYVGFKGQRAWYGDSEESAKLKGIILGFLTMIPTPIPSVVYVSAGVLGLLNRKKA